MWSMKCAVCCVECEVRNVEFEVWSVESDAGRELSVECGVWSAK